MTAENPKPTMKIVPNQEGWVLCDLSEILMRKAIGDNAIVVVNGIPVKLDGKITGLILEDIPVENGTMKAGSWYSPRSHYARNRIRQAYFQGKAELFLPHVNWVYMRNLNDVDRNGNSLTLDFVRRTIKSLAHKTSEQQRRQFYNQNYEDL